MRSLVCFTLLLIFASELTGQNKVNGIADLKGMAGCWERKDEKKSLLIPEVWMEPAGTSIFGMGRTVKSGKTVDYEFMLIEKRDNGIFFIARPKDNSADTAFKLIRSNADEVVFENPDHDFPQRVIYKWSGNTLTGRIEGKEKGKSVGIDFPMGRVKCAY